MNKNRSLELLAALVALTWPFAATAQEDNLSQANNPLANTTAFNVQSYYIDEFTDIDEGGSQFLLRYAKPLTLGSSQWLMRATFPINNFPVGPSLSHRSGPGDIDIFAAYLMDTGDPGVSFGIGPQVVFPTASPQELGSEQWQLGVANVYFNGRSKTFQYGYLAIYRTGVGSTNGRERVNLLAFQPFVFLQLGSGWYTGTAPVWTYDFNSDDYTIPIGARIGKVFKSGNVIFNVFAEPQVSVADAGAGLPEKQIFFGFNMQY